MNWDERTLSLLIDRHAPLVRGVLRRFSTDADVLADLAQETFLRALVCLPSLKDTNAFGPWVASIARNVALERFRSSKREQSRLQRASGDLVPPEPDEVAEASLVEYALRQLPPEVGRTLRLYYFEDLDTRTVAERLGCSEATARQRLSRGRSKLKEIIMDTVRQNDEMGDLLVKRLLEIAKSLSQQGKYQEAVDRFMEAFNTSSGPLTALTRLPEDVRQAFEKTWDNAFVYRPPEAIQQPEGPVVDDYRDWSAYADLLEEIPKARGRELIGTVEDIGRRLQISPAWVYLWWKQGLPHIRMKDSGTVRFNLALVRQWIEKNHVKMPPKADAAESYFLVKAIAYGLREGILTPEDVEVLVNVFMEREAAGLYQSGASPARRSQDDRGHRHAAE